ncbi:MAG: tRNA lysidine(34) synthetase TilS [Clostridia bacterium]|nr:tRNA lysidine(34) synthetase TilS [Clostridia bacterium]
MKDNKMTFDLAYKSFLSTIREYGMQEQILRGVLVGFSGGADSMLLLHLLLRYQKENRFPLVAVHVHHGIRGETADRDAHFTEEICKSLGVDFCLLHTDVPALAESESIGIEEAARNARYSCFYNIIQSRNDISSIALGHNSTDNLETVIFHLMRGCGSGGLAGIPPVRENIIRPLIGLSKEDIRSALSEKGILYIEDETNLDTAYTRNYIRHEILPKLSRLSASPEVSVRRVCRNLICDNDFLNREADKIYSLIKEDGISRDKLAPLHPAIFARVMLKWCEDHRVRLSRQQIDAIGTRIAENTPFSFDLAGDLCFFADTDICYLKKREKNETGSESFAKSLEIDRPLLLTRGAFLLTRGECENFSPNIYNFSIKVNLASAIIEGELFVRYRRDGDAYYYGGMTHKLKKIFNDRKLPLRERETIPILCDAKGIVWVPGFGVRDDGAHSENALTAAFFF